jgi:rhodanese-related sulfurtransferase
MMITLLAVFLATVAPAPAPTITPRELYALMQKGDAVVIDVRGSVPYDLGHIDGAISMPLGLVTQRATELPQDKLVAAYCSCKLEEQSNMAVRQLNNHGFERAVALKGGYDAWVAAGLPVVKAVDPDAGAPPPPQTPRGAGRYMVPPFVTCDRNDVTSYAGVVTSYKRTKSKVTIRIHTDADTDETVTVHDAPKSFYVMGERFMSGDWKKIGRGKRVVAWVCKDGSAKIDWRPGETRGD